MEGEHKGFAQQSIDRAIEQDKDAFWNDRKTRVVGRARCRVARQMAQWAASDNDKQQHRLMATKAPAPETTLSSKNGLAQPLLDVG